MDKYIEIHRNKSLRLDNVLIKNIFEISTLNEDDDKEDEDFSLDLEVDKMINEIRVKGANQVGPLIQYSGSSIEEESFEIKVVLMLQADRFINNLQPPYRMESVIQAKDCMYTRFSGAEEDVQYAYQKIQVDAYENNIKLNGNSYTIFLDSDDDGNITADIFMEKDSR